MRRVVSLLVVVFVSSALACAGEGAWPEQGAGSTSQSQSQELALATVSTTVSTSPASDGGTSDGGTIINCTVEEPPVPPVPMVTNLDTWDFANTPLLPLTSTTRSMYLVAHASPDDSTRMYVYGIDVTAQRFVFVGTLAKRMVGQLTQRVGIDIGRFQGSGATDPSSGVSIQIEGPAPPPPPPGIHTPDNYAKLGWRVAVLHHNAVQALHY